MAEYQDTMKDLLKRSDNDSATASYMEYSKFVTEYSGKIKSDFDTLKSKRRSYELNWLEDLKQFKGIYSNDVAAALSKTNRSKANLRITRTKIKTVDSKIMDILFPANSDKNWGIMPSPVPELSQDKQQLLITQISQNVGRTISEEEYKEILYREALKSCRNMEREIEDALNKIEYVNIVRSAVHSGNKYGTGIIKGVLAKEDIKKMWVLNEEGVWASEEVRTIYPYIEFASIWNTYLDMEVTDPDQMRYVYQRHVLPKHEVLTLAKRSDFNKDVIRAYVETYADGDASLLEYEVDLRELNSGNDTVPYTREGMYELIECWKYDDIKTLRDAGIDVPEEIEDGEVLVNIWTIGSAIIKATISPLENSSLPFFIYYYDKTEDSIYGEGLSSIMRDPAQLINASARAMLDNAAIASGPIIEANMDLLVGDEDPTDIYPRRVFQRISNNPGDAGYPAIRIHNINAHTNEYMEMAEYFRALGDEITTIPRYLQGDTSSLSGAGRTSGGLSMMLGSATVPIKDQIKCIDLNITRKLIKSMYDWFMQFSSKQDIKGDFEVIAKGTSSLIAKEVRLQNLLNFLTITNNPVDISMTNRDIVLKDIVAALDLDDKGYLKSREEIILQQRAAAAAAEEDKNFQREIQIESHKPAEVSASENRMQPSSMDMRL